MAEVSSVVLNYAVRGADRAQRKDKQVRESIQRTGRTARKQSGAIKRWMQRHQTAIAGIAAATAGAMLSIVKHSPTLRGELAGVRLAFSLFAMTIGEDVAPATSGLSDKALDLQDAYAGLPDPIRKPISALIGFGLAAAFVATVFAGLETIIGGTVIASVLGTLAGYASAAGAAFVGLVSGTALLIGVLIGLLALAAPVSSELLGITNATDRVTESQNGLVRAAANLIFFMLGPFMAAVAFFVAFWEGGWDNALRVAKRFMGETLKAGARFLAGIGAFLSSMVSIIHTAFEVAFDFAVNAAKAAMNQIVSAVVDGVNRAIKAMNRMPGMDIGTVSAGSGFDVESPGQIMGRASDRLDRRFDRTRSNLQAFRERHAAEQVRVSPNSSQPAVEDNSVTVENLNVPVQSTGSEELDGRRVGERAMEYIGEQQARRQ